VRRAVVTWVVVVGFALAAGAAAVVALNATAFGAAGFVRVYLEAVSRGDAAGALAMPGVTVDPRLRADFLVDDALAGPAELREITVAPGENGVELVTVAWTRGERDAVSTFAVERTGSRLGLFPEWAFAVSPVATLQLVVEHDERFDLNGVATTTGAGAEAVAYAVLVPGVYRVDHHSAYLRAAAVEVVADRPASELGATLDVRPADGFLERITEEVHAQLDDCVTQEVLFPTGCPIGHAIANRVVSAPAWSIVEYPELTVGPGPVFGTWLVPDAGLVSHLTVDVQSLFDGSVSTFDEDLPAIATYLVTIGADDATLRVTLVG
jgi:hypothetical protein